MERLPILSYTAATTALIYTGKAILYSVNVTGHGADGDAQLYDGMGTTGKQLLSISVISKTTFGHHYHQGIFIDKGLYLVANAATTRVTIEYLPID